MVYGKSNDEVSSCYGDCDDDGKDEVLEMADMRKGLGGGAGNDVVRWGPEA